VSLNTPVNEEVLRAAIVCSKLCLPGLTAATRVNLGPSGWSSCRWCRTARCDRCRTGGEPTSQRLLAALLQRAEQDLPTRLVRRCRIDQHRGSSTPSTTCSNRWHARVHRVAAAARVGTASSRTIAARSTSSVHRRCSRHRDDNRLRVWALTNTRRSTRRRELEAADRRGPCGALRRAAESNQKDGKPAAARLPDDTTLATPLDRCWQFLLTPPSRHMTGDLAARQQRLGACSRWPSPTASSGCA